MVGVGGCCGQPTAGTLEKACFLMIKMFTLIGRKLENECKPIAKQMLVLNFLKIRVLHCYANVNMLFSFPEPYKRKLPCIY